MKHEKIWKYTCFFVALALVLYGVHLARIDAVLHGACKKQLHYSRFATYGLYLFCLTAAALLLYAVWLILHKRQETSYETAKFSGFSHMQDTLSIPAYGYRKRPFKS